MTRGKIIEAAVKLWEAAGPEGFTIHKLAARLKVVRTTIRAHVKGGIAELRREIARRVLADLTPPYTPDQLRAKFRFRGAKIEAPKFPQCIGAWSAICSKYCPPYSPGKPTRFPGRQKPSQFRSVSEACREFRPFSRALRRLSDASRSVAGVHEVGAAAAIAVEVNKAG